MSRREMRKDWWKAEGGRVHAELPVVRPILRAVPLTPADVLQAVPPFSGRSRRLLTRAEACVALRPGQPPASLTFLDKQIRLGMIYPIPQGRNIWIPEEEIENFNTRSRMLYMERHA